MQIRAAQPSDASILVDFNQAMAQETEGKVLDRETLTSGIKTLLTRPELGFYLVAEEKIVAPNGMHKNAVVAGLMVTKEWSDWRNGEFWWIQSVYVRPEFRRRGIYRSLYQSVKQRASQENVCGFRLYVERENQVAQATYQALGMEETIYRMYEQMAV